MPFRRIVAAALFVAPPLFSAAFAQSIALDKEDATVWAQEQVISGTIEGAVEGVLLVNDAEIPFSADGGTFAVPIWLEPGVTVVLACTADQTVCSVPRELTLGFVPRPEVEVRATVEGTSVNLTGEVLDNPSGGALAFSWAASPDNPAPIALSAGDYAASFTIPGDAPAGEYYVAWTVEAADGGERTARTFVTVREDGAIVPFVIEEDAAAWIDEAVVYGVAPYYFVRVATNQNQSFNAIRDKLPEIASLGVNTLWLQPTFQSPGGGHSYDVSDFFAVSNRFGTEQDLRDLIADAREFGMRVIFDLPPNHSSILHPYAQDAVAHGPRSHYYDFYQREFDNAPYSQHYNLRHEGLMTFVYYFWPNLPNLDYSNPEVRRHMIEAARYWVEEFGIDGYRFDAPWGLDGRTPDFIPEMRAALKRIRPDILMLGEDKATLASRFDNRYDVAYDWTPSMSWVSQWMWQTTFSHDSNPTIFNDAGVTTRSYRLRQALTNFGNGWAEGARVFRFLENNDTFRFLPTHDVERTRMAAALLMSLPGIPLIYNGQEVGITSHPLSQFTVFTSGGTIQSHDQHGLFPYYAQLVSVREAFPALTSQNLAEVPVTPLSAGNRTFSYRRWTGDDNVIGVINMGPTPVNAVLGIPVADMGLEPDKTYYLTNLLTGDYLSADASQLSSYQLPVEGYTTVLFAVADSVVTVPISTETPVPTRPLALRLEPNYPNPFTGQTSLAYEVSAPGPVRLRVVDLLGRAVATLVDEPVLAGRHVVTFDAGRLASGVYVAILERDGRRLTQRMTVVR